MSESLTHAPGGFTASAHVVRGGNRMMKIVAHLVCRDVNGQVRFEVDAEASCPIPAGDEVPLFRCEDVRAWVHPEDLVVRGD